jgi:hypothetical protein
MLVSEVVEDGRGQAIEVRRVLEIPGVAQDIFVDSGTWHLRNGIHFEKWGYLEGARRCFL